MNIKQYILTVSFLLCLYLEYAKGESILEAQQKIIERDYQISRQFTMTNLEKQYENLKRQPKFIQFIQRSFSQIKKKEQTIQIYGFLFFLIFLIVYFLALSIKNQIKTTLKMKLFRLINNILGDISIILFISSLILIINYYDGFSFLDSYLYLDSLCMAIAIFSIIWLFIGVYNILVSQTQSKIWREYEKQIPNRKVIKNDYENLHMLINHSRYYPENRIEQVVYTSQQYTELKVKRDILEYFLMRQEFIAPSYQPTCTENFLREDFDFSNYLIRCLGELGKQVFKINGYSMIILIFLIGLRLFLSWLDEENDYSFYIMSSIPLIIMLFLIVFLRKVMINYRMLVNIVDSPVEVKFTEFEKNRDPMANIDRLRQPQYLLLPYDLESQYNQHEKLFWFNKPEISYQFIHIPLFIQSVWMIEMLYEYYTPKIYLYYLLLSLSVGFSFISVFILIPALFYYVTIVTNIQMLKKKQIIQKVVFDQRRFKARQIEKFSQYLNDEARNQGRSNVSFREAYIEKKQYDDIRDSFQFHQQLEKKQQNEQEHQEEADEESQQHKELEVTLDKFVSVVKQLGSTLNYTAFKILVRRCVSKEKGTTVTYENFVKYLKEKQAFFGVDANEFIQLLFTEVFNENVRQENKQLISEKRLRKIIKQSKIFTTNTEIDDIIEEVNYLHSDGVNISIPVLVDYITDTVECYPK
ncbi:transmembrane protein, putative (macronuclear) [Tetrahymena thermophila SB210]|uniref:Transmembrane protein, putative n=1 Tax=Tetrahymena thermophila (strain SB210) TaxID=312017 RepID=Q22XW5_TETTS|nr:transmembrane protein, putative [Tetrahymena thermophila SB210]EAR90259.2 transmembrane protein, putative [Tetrahymena thermophila SB210]|eukprot:XP_001010504.2 transmembrane protein, putative [Tetrahymena thermophila SB210]